MLGANPGNVLSEHDEFKLIMKVKIFRELWFVA